MNTTTMNHVIIGKMSTPRIDGQISLFPLPQQFEWLKHFSAEEIAEFFTELMEALQHSLNQRDISEVNEVIESWKATANIEADPTVAADVQQGVADVAEGRGVSWADLRKELQL